MKYIGENAIKKLIALIKSDLAKKQNSITVSGLLKGDGTTISAAVAEIDYMAPPTGGITGQILKKTETGTEWADGKSAYQSAVEAGYSGTETAFNTALSNVPGHIADGNIHVTAEEKQAWSDSDVFIATYGTTTSAEIEAAISSGKSVYVKEVGDDSYFTGVYIGQSPHGYFRFLAAKPKTVGAFDNMQKYFKFEEWICSNSGWSDNGEIEYAVNPKRHASTHASGGSDPITPADIGAATMAEVNAAIQTAIGNAIGGSY